MIGYLFLALTILSEATGTTMMKLSDGFSKLPASVAALGCYGCTLFFMTMSLKRLPMGLVYAVWSGAGVVLVTLIGHFLFGERLQPAKLLWIGCVIAGVAGLNAFRT